MGTSMVSNFSNLSKSDKLSEKIPEKRNWPEDLNSGCMSGESIYVELPRVLHALEFIIPGLVSIIQEYLVCRCTFVLDAWFPNVQSEAEAVVNRLGAEEIIRSSMGNQCFITNIQKPIVGYRKVDDIVYTGTLGRNSHWRENARSWEKFTSSDKFVTLLPSDSPVLFYAPDAELYKIKFDVTHSVSYWTSGKSLRFTWATGAYFGSRSPTFLKLMKQYPSEFYTRPGIRINDNTIHVSQASRLELTGILIDKSVQGSTPTASASLKFHTNLGEDQKLEMIWRNHHYRQLLLDHYLTCVGCGGKISHQWFLRDGGMHPKLDHCEPCSVLLSIHSL